MKLQVTTAAAWLSSPYVLVAVYLWTIFTAAILWVDLATDIRVLAEVWDAWPMWVILASILTPYGMSGFFVAEYYVSKRKYWRSIKRVRFKWM
jgi:hypothetical protein